MKISKNAKTDQYIVHDKFLVRKIVVEFFAYGWSKERAISSKDLLFPIVFMASIDQRSTKNEKQLFVRGLIGQCKL